MLDVPSPTILGESVELTCSYELDNEQLYSVKWYKNDVEFYRYVPNDWPPGQFLPLPGIRVDVSYSSVMFCKRGTCNKFLSSISLNVLHWSGNGVRVRRPFYNVCCVHR